MKKSLQTNYLLATLLLTIPTYTCAKYNTVTATINTGVTPTGMAITHDHHTAYVANNNNYGIANKDSVSVLDLENNSVKTIIYDDSFVEPYTVTLSPNGKRAYVTNSNGTTITIIKTKNNKVIGTIDGFDGPSDMVITPDGLFAYVNNYGANSCSGLTHSIRLVDLELNTIIGAPILVDLAPAALALSPHGKYLYVISYVDGNPGTGTLSIITTNDNVVVDVITGFSGPFDIAITPNGKYAFVTNFGSNNFTPIGTTVSMVNLHDRQIVKTFNLGIQPSGIAITPDGRYAYATNYNTLYADNTNFTGLTSGQGTVNIIDIKKRKVITPTIAVGQSPHGIAIARNGKHAYVTNFASNTVSVIKIQNNDCCNN